MAFADYWGRIVGAVPNVDPLAAQRFVNDAWKDILESRLWSFLVTEGVLVAPQIITAGTVTVTQFSNVVQLDSTAQAAVANLQNPLITQRQFRCGLGGGRIYNISAYDPNTARITLDGIYMEASGVGQPFQIYRCYYQAADINGNLITDFQMFKIIANTSQGYAIMGANLRRSKAEFDVRDPQRGSQGNAYEVGTYKVDSNGYPIFELWPHPTSQAAYLNLVQRRGTPLSDSQDIPGTLSPQLLITGSLDFAYDWAVANMGRFPELKGVDWQLLKAENHRKFQKMLNDAIRHDDDIFLTSFLPQWRDYGNFGPVDADFIQSHDFAEWGV